MNQELKAKLCTDLQTNYLLLIRIYEAVGKIIKSPSFSQLCDFLNQKEENPPKIKEIPPRDMVAESCGFIPAGFDTISAFCLNTKICSMSSLKRILFVEKPGANIVVMRGKMYFVHIENTIKFLSEVKGYKLVSYHARKFIESRKNT